MLAPRAPKPTIPAFLMGLAAFPEEVPKDSLAHLVGLPHPGAPTGTMKSLVSRHGSDGVGGAKPSERSARRIAAPYRAVLESDATPGCPSMASADRQMIGDATLDARRCVWRGALPAPERRQCHPHPL